MPRPLEYRTFFDAVEHAYFDDRMQRHRSVTQILWDAGCIDFSMVDPLVLQAAAMRGTQVHQLSAEWDRVRLHKTTLYEFLYAAPEHLHGYLIQYEAFLLRTGFRAIASETERPRIVNIAGIKVGMTPDRIGHFPYSRRTVVLDLKTGTDLFSHPLQLAGYSLGVEKVLQLAMQHERIALYLEPESYRTKYFRHGQDYHAFLDALHGGGHYLEAWKQQRQRNLVA